MPESFSGVEIFWARIVRLPMNPVMSAMTSGWTVVVSVSLEGLEQCDPLDVEIISEELLRQLSYAIKNQLKAPKAPYNGAPYNRFFPSMKPLILMP